MHCGRVSNLLSAYIDRELAGSEMLQIRRHLDECPGCSTEIEALGRVKSLLALAPPDVPPDDPVSAVLRRRALGREPSPTPTSRGSWNWNWKWLSFPPHWQRYGLAFTCGCLALALAGTALALRKPNYPDAVAANVLKSIEEIGYTGETLPAPEPGAWLEMLPPDSILRRPPPRLRQIEVMPDGAGGPMTGMLVSDSVSPPIWGGR
jgi:hypothetical protein